MSRTRDQLEEYLRRLVIRTGSVLDVGGSQRPVRSRIKNFECTDYKILDLPQPHEVAVKPDIEGDLNVFQEWPTDKFDTVFCLEVFDYIYDPVSAIQNLGELTKSGGTLFVSFPFLYPHHNPIEEDMLRYTEFGARKLLELGGFEVEQIVYRTADRDNLLDFYRDEGMRTAKGYDHHDVVTFNFKAKKK